MLNGCIALPTSWWRRSAFLYVVTIRHTLNMWSPRGNPTTPSFPMWSSPALPVGLWFPIMVLKQWWGMYLIFLRDPSLSIIHCFDVLDICLFHPFMRSTPRVHAVHREWALLAENRQHILWSAGVCGKRAVGRVSLIVKLGILVDASGGFGWREMAREASRGVVQAFHAATWAVLVRIPSQEAVVIAGEVTCGGTRGKNRKGEQNRLLERYACLSL